MSSAQTSAISTRSRMLHPESLPLWIALAALVLASVALFGSTFLNLVSLWQLDQNYSHGYLIAPIALILAIRIYRKVGPPLHGELALGFSGIFLGILCQLTATIVRWPPLSYLGLACTIRGALVCAGGRTWAAAFSFPLLFSFFMFPLPVTWTSYAALWLQDSVARLSETVVSLFVVCHRVGHSIRMAGVDKTLVVAEECSGLGQIVAFFAFAALLGHLLSRPNWHRLALLAASIPASIAANTLRIVLMNLGAYYFGTKWISGLLHDLPALFSIPVGIAIFLSLDRLLSGLTDSRSNVQAHPVGEIAKEASPRLARQRTSGAAVRGLVAATGLLTLGAVAQFELLEHLRATDALSYPELVESLDALPLVLADPKTGRTAWVGRELDEMRSATRAKLPFQADDLLVRSYRNLEGAEVLVYAVYSRAGEDRKHHPEICIRDVSGAPEDLAFRKPVPLTADGSSVAQRFRFQPGAGRSTVVYYWHYAPYPIADPGRSRVQTLHLRLGMTPPSATVQVTAGTDDPRTLESIEKQLLPALDLAAHRRILPPECETASNRLPIGLVRD